MSTPFTRRDGTRGVSESVLLRQSWKEAGKVHTNTVASLSKLPPAQIDVLEAVINHGATLTGGATLPAPVLGAGRTHGGVAAVAALIDQLGLPGMIGPACRQRDLILGLVAARVCHPASKASQVTWWADTTLGADWGLDGATTDEVYEAMDWLLARRDALEDHLVGRWLKDETSNPHGLVLCDLTSTWLEGAHCPLAEYGYSRDGKKGLPQIEFVLVCDPRGLPVGVRVFKGDTADPGAFPDIVAGIRDRYRMSQAVVVGDRGMVTSKGVEALTAAGIGWVGALRRSQITALAAQKGPFQPSLFDERGILTCTSDEFPQERLIVCYNPARAEAARTLRQVLVEKTLTLIAPIGARVDAGRLVDPARIGQAVGRVIDRYHVASLIQTDIREHHLGYGPDTPTIRQAEALDGLYVIRTSLEATDIDDAGVIATYHNLNNVERDFSWLKSIDLQVRPVRHWLAGRVEAHLLICLLGLIITWHLRAAWKPLTFTDEQNPTPSIPARPARRSHAAHHKTATRTSPDGQPLHDFHGLLTHIAGLDRHPITYHTPTGPLTIQIVAQPTPIQAEAFRLIGAPIPQTIKPAR